MAQGRIINKSISLSEKVNTISDGASLLYTWMIPHSDDFGLLQGSALTIKALVAPMKSWTVAQVDEFLKEMIEIGLIKVVTYENKTYYQILNSKQYLKKDRNPQTILPVKLGKDFEANWKAIESILEVTVSQVPDNDSQTEPVGIQLESNVIQLEAEVKGSEVKRKEENKRFASLSDLTSQVLSEVATEQHVKLKDVEATFERMKAWLSSKNKRYKNYRAGLVNWVLKRIDEGKISRIQTDVVPSPVVLPQKDISPEERQKNLQAIAEIKQKFGRTAQSASV